MLIQISAPNHCFDNFTQLDVDLLLHHQLGELEQPLVTHRYYLLEFQYQELGFRLGLPG